MEKINIAELLKDAPKGTQIYTPMYGYMDLKEVYKYANTYHIRLFKPIHKDGRGYELYTNKYGQIWSDNVSDKPDGLGECILFPSKDCRMWENFKAPWKYKRFEPFQKVLVKDGNYWYAAFYDHWYNKQHGIIGGTRQFDDDEICSYDGNESLLGKKVE